MVFSNLFFLLSLVLLGSVQIARASIADSFFLKAFDQLRPGLKEIHKDHFELEPELTLQNLYVEGLDGFEPVALDVELLPLKLRNLTLIIESVYIESSYTMTYFTVPRTDITLSGEGELSINATGIRIEVQSNLGSKRRKIFLRDLEDAKLTAEDIQIRITGLAGGGSVGKFLSNLINSVAKKAFNLFASQYLIANQKKILMEVNERMKTVVL